MRSSESVTESLPKHRASHFIGISELAKSTQSQQSLVLGPQYFYTSPHLLDIWRKKTKQHTGLYQ